MSQDPYTRALERLDRYRLIALVTAVALLIVSIVFDVDWLAWPRAIAWAAAGVISILEGRIHKRMGHNPGGAYLRAALFFLVALLCVI